MNINKSFRANLLRPDVENVISCDHSAVVLCLTVLKDELLSLSLCECQPHTIEGSFDCRQQAEEINVYLTMHITHSNYGYIVLNM